MIQTIHLTPDVVLRHCPDHRFKKSALSVQLLRPMCKEEAALNSLLPAVLLRGTEHHPDLRSITWKLDELYGASVNTMVRRIGDVQTVGFYMSIMEDRFALEETGVLTPAADFLRELMLEPLTVEGCFDAEIVESEKKNLISAIESELNDKRSYASAQMLRRMCAGDSFAVPRLGTVEDVAAITPEQLYAHYQKILRESRAELFYVGAAAPEQVAELVRPFALAMGTDVRYRPTQTGLTPESQGGTHFETMDINQGKLSMGFTTSVTNRHPDFAAMQVFNAVYGAGMTSKLFVNVREKLSLCYYAGSAYYGSKGIVTVSSGIDESNYETARAEILRQLRLTAEGQITEAELSAAKQGIISGLRSVPDAPGALENFYGTASIAGMRYDLPAYIEAISAVTARDVARCAASVRLHTVFFLKGEAK